MLQSMESQRVRHGLVTEQEENDNWGDGDRCEKAFSVYTIHIILFIDIVDLPVCRSGSNS